MSPQMISKKTSAIKLYAGPKALKSIQENGLTPQSIKVIVGASGGPKWFVLNRLDRFIFGEWLSGISHSIHLLGSSSGSWRFACFAQQNPMDAYDRLEEAYRDQRYPDKPSPQFVKQRAEEMLHYILGSDGLQHILDNPHFHTNIMAVRSKAFTRSTNRGTLLAGLALSFLANIFHRRSLGLFYERAFFHAPKEKPPFFHLNDFPTQHIKLTSDNLEKALIATGAIPLVVSPVTNISGATPGLYRDGGLLDYNFDIPFLGRDDLDQDDLNQDQDGIVLYPHFNNQLIPGWFDKALTWRNPIRSHLDNILLICPSDELVGTLRYQKIPDRKDYKVLDHNERIDYWNSVLTETECMAEEFSEIVSSESVSQFIEPIGAGR